jgi:hypothetical protein
MTAGAFGVYRALACLQSVCVDFDGTGQSQACKGGKEKVWELHFGVRWVCLLNVGARALACWTLEKIGAEDAENAIEIKGWIPRAFISYLVSRFSWNHADALDLHESLTGLRQILVASPTLRRPRNLVMKPRVWYLEIQPCSSFRVNRIPTDIGQCGTDPVADQSSYFGVLLASTSFLYLPNTEARL